MKTQLFLIGLLAGACAVLPAQAAQNQAAQTQSERELARSHDQPATLSSPSGNVPGRLIITRDDLVFLDPQQPQNSIVIPKGDVNTIDFNSSARTVQVRLKHPVTYRATELSNVSLHMARPAGVQMVTTWWRPGIAPPPVRTDGQAARPAGTPAGTMMFQAKHKHKVGSDTGTLTITPTQIMYTSATDAKANRRWSMADIKEVRRDDPYSLKIVPYSGDTYNLELTGSGMGADQYKTLTDRVAMAHLPPAAR